MIQRTTLILLCLGILAATTPALAFQARVVEVVDGDTITVEPTGAVSRTPGGSGGSRIRVRLHGIDCPELDQPYGTAARRFVIDAVLFKQVNVQPAPQGADRNGKTAAIVEIPGVGVLQELLLSAGLAWVWPQYCTDCKAWEEMQARAMGEREGLWARLSTSRPPVEPWEWRQRK